MKLLLLIGGLATAALGAFAWPLMKRLPSHRLRSRIYGEKAARVMVIVAGLFFAAVGGLMLALGP